MTFSAAEYATRLRTIADALAAWSVDAALISNPGDLRYLTGFGGLTSLGPNPFTGGPSAALLATRDGALLALPASDTALVQADGAQLELEPFETFLDLRPLDPRRRLAESVLNALDRAGFQGGRLGYQPESLPVEVQLAITSKLDRVDWRRLDGAVSLLRMRKSERELALVRRAVEVCDHAQALVAGTAGVGVSELEILAAVQDRVRHEVGEAEVPLIYEVTSGPNSGAIGNAPSERRLTEGDLLLTDIAPQVDGYWGDSCATRPIGEPTADRKRMLSVVEEALVLGTEAVRPGITASELDRVMRDHVATAFPTYHNSGGHGIGVDYHEPPRLIPDEQIPLEEGMVLALEPGVYLGEAGGVRLEHLVLVTADGAEVLSRHLTPRE